MCPNRQKDSGECSLCGFPANIPGVLRRIVDVNASNFGDPVPCPQCYLQKMSLRKKQAGQLEGILRLKTFNNYYPMDGGLDGLAAAKAFVDNPTGWLTLYGDHGPGKSHLCAAIANHLGDGSVLYYNTSDLTSALKEDFSQSHNIIKRINNTSVLILDELDKAHIVKWTREQMQRIFDHRDRNSDKYGLVIATNEPPESYDGDLAFIRSRMRYELYRCVEMTGDNRPQAKALEALAKMNNVESR